MPPDHAAAKKPERDKGLRALYHKLAQRYHPDRAEPRIAHGARSHDAEFLCGIQKGRVEHGRDLGVPHQAQQFLLGVRQLPHLLIEFLQFGS
jgi:hypothetical protein